MTDYPIFSFDHDWQDGFTETLEWLTSILVSQTGAEQRLQQRLAPRRFFEYTLTLNKSERALFDLLVTNVGLGTFLIPVAHDLEILPNTLPAGTTHINIDTEGREFLTGSRALLKNQDSRQYEILRIDQVIETGLDLIVPTQSEWAGGSRIYPLIMARLMEQPQMVRKTDTLWMGSVKFMSMEQNDWPIGSNRNILLNEDGLVVNAFQPSSGRGAYFDQASGTSEGQLILMMGLMDCWEMTGDARAYTLATRMWSATAHTTYDDVYPPLPITQTATFAPHWLFVVKKPIKASVVNYGETFVFANGIAQVPDVHGPTRLVFQVLSTDYSLLWKNPYSSLLTGEIYKIDNYSYDPIAEVTNVTLTENYNGELVVIYSSQNGNRLNVGDRYEAWPDWRPLAANETDCACDTLAWAFKAFNQAARVYGDQYYLDGEEATRQQTAIIYDVNDSRDWIKPSFTKNAFGAGSRFSFSTRGSPVVFDCDEEGNVLMTVPTGTGEAQYGNASVKDVFGDQDVVTVMIGSTRPVTVDLYIDPTETYDYNTRWSTTVQLAGSGSLQTFTFMRKDFKTVNGVQVPINAPVYTFGVDDKNPRNHTIILGRVRVRPNLVIPYYPGAIPFTANFLGQPFSVLIDWRGPVYMGYQSPPMWWYIAKGEDGNPGSHDFTGCKNCIQMLADAQQARIAQTGENGPFAPVFYFNRQDAYEYGDVNTFGFIGPDPNTGWGGYQYRPLAECGEQYFLDSGSEIWHAQVKTIVMRFLTFINTKWTSPNGPPTDYPQSGAETNYDEPHFAALIVRAALYIDMKDLPGTPNSVIQSVINKAMAFWTRDYVSDKTNRMYGTFCVGLNTGWFGFWHGELMRTMRQLYNWYTVTRPNAAQAAIVAGWMGGLMDWAWANSLVPPTIYAYQGYTVMTTPPDETNDLAYNFARMENTVDNTIAQPLDNDEAGKSFSVQAHNWTPQGREDHITMRDLLYTLKGRSTPVWVPTFMADMDLQRPAFAGQNYFFIDYVGYSSYGYGLFGRRDICIQMRDGTQVYATIVSGLQVGDLLERITLTTKLPVDITPENVLRISYMALCRLDQDSIDWKHITDNSGVSQLGATFKAMGDFRQGDDITPPPFPVYIQTDQPGPYDYTGSPTTAANNPLTAADVTDQTPNYNGTGASGN